MESKWITSTPTATVCWPRLRSATLDPLNQKRPPGFEILFFLRFAIAKRPHLHDKSPYSSHAQQWRHTAPRSFRILPGRWNGLDEASAPSEPPAPQSIPKKHKKSWENIRRNEKKREKTWEKTRENTRKHEKMWGKTRGCFYFVKKRREFQHNLMQKVHVNKHPFIARAIDPEIALEERVQSV